MSTQIYQSAAECVETLIKVIGNNIVIATPLGLGKPTQFLNAVYNHAKNNEHVTLTIITALSLVKPTIKNDLAKRLATPILNRLYKNHVDLYYEIDRRNQILPKNVKVIEFYLALGEYNDNMQAQQNYISSNYTHVIRDLLAYDVNIIAQLIASDNNTNQFSLSCNADITLDLIQAFKKNKPGNMQPLFIGEINQSLPYMYGESSEVSKENFYAIIDNKNNDDLFIIPRPIISEQDFMIGLYGSTLIKDNGCLQIGIGSLSDALVYALIMRHKDNKTYIDALNHFQIIKKFNSVIQNVGEISIFKKGLFGSTEMLVDGFIDLYKNDILKRKVYDDVILQKLLNDNLINENITIKTLELLIQYNKISAYITNRDFDFLKLYGIINNECVSYKDGFILLATGEKIHADLANDLNRSEFIKKCLGDKLKNGRILHAGFFVGSSNLYTYLKLLDINEKKLFDMRSIKKINQLYNSEVIDSLQRINARFVNSALKVTLLGAVISDALKDGIVISGVGGQYNFIAMSHELHGARSIINCRSTFQKNGKIESNIEWEYGTATIPRHLRDIVVTEYGIADCRSKTDNEVIKALLNIIDSRFQNKLLQTAKKYNKLEKDYQIPEEYNNNYPHVISNKIKFFQNIYQEYPFSQELTKEEVQLKKALKYLNTCSWYQLILMLFKGIFLSNVKYDNLIKRMDLVHPKNCKEYLYVCLLRSSLKQILNE